MFHTSPGFEARVVSKNLVKSEIVYYELLNAIQQFQLESFTITEINKTKIGNMHINFFLAQTQQNIHSSWLIVI